jgi:hypothetical protein
MAITEPFTGTHVVTTATEWSCTTDTAGPDLETSDGVFQLFLDVNDMITGDELAIKIYEKCRTGDTQRVIYQSNLIGPQSPPTWVSPSLILLNGWDMTLNQIAGTANITVLWSIRKVA